MAKREGIIRVRRRKEQPYVVVDKGFLENARLSWKAKGLLTYLLSRPDDWRPRVSQLAQQSVDGESAVRAAIKELEAEGYVRRERKNDPKTGRITAWDTIVFETPELARQATADDPGLFETSTLLRPKGAPKPPNPHSEPTAPDSGFPHVDFPHVGGPHVENRTLLNNERTKNDSLRNDGRNGPPPPEVEDASLAAAASPPPLSADDAVLALVGERFTPDDARRQVAQHGPEQVGVAIGNANILAAKGKLKHRKRYIAAALTRRYEPMADDRPARVDAGAEAAAAETRRVAAQARQDQLDAELREIDAYIATLSDSTLAARVEAIKPALPMGTRAKLDAGESPRSIAIVRHLVYSRRGHGAPTATA